MLQLKMNSSTVFQKSCDVTCCCFSERVSRLEFGEMEGMICEKHCHCKCRCWVICVQNLRTLYALYPRSNITSVLICILSIDTANVSFTVTFITIIALITAVINL